MKPVEKLNFVELKKETQLRDVYKKGMTPSAMKNAVQKHRDESPDFDLAQASDGQGSPVEEKQEIKELETKNEKTMKAKKTKAPKKAAKVKKAVKKVSSKKKSESKPKEKKVSAEPKIKKENGISMKETILKLHKDGKDIKAIAKETSFKPKTIHEAIYKNNILSSFDKGKTAKEISEKFGYGLAPINAHIKKYRSNNK